MSGPVKIRLVEGDAFARRTDLAIIGTGPNLMRRIEEGGNCSFVRTRYPEFLLRKYGPLDGLRHSLVATPEGLAWSRVIAFPSRPTEMPRRSLISEYVEVLNALIRGQIRPKDILILPLQNRPSQSVAMLSLFMAWSISRLSLPGRRVKQQPDITIGALEGVAEVRKYATEEVGQFRDYAGKQLDRLWWSGDWTEMEAPTFEIISGDL